MPVRRQVTDADRVWNRACSGEEADWREGDQALRSVLLVNGYIQNGGVCHAFDLPADELTMGIAGYEFFGLHELAAIIQPHEGEDEEAYNKRYYQLEGIHGSIISEKFNEMFHRHPERFAPLSAQ